MSSLRPRISKIAVQPPATQHATLPTTSELRAELLTRMNQLTIKVMDLADESPFQALKLIGRLEKATAAALAKPQGLMSDTEELESQEITHPLEPQKLMSDTDELESQAELEPEEAQETPVPESAFDADVKSFAKDTMSKLTTLALETFDRSPAEALRVLTLLEKVVIDEPPTEEPPDSGPPTETPADDEPEKSTEAPTDDETEEDTDSESSIQNRVSTPGGSGRIADQPGE